VRDDWQAVQAAGTARFPADGLVPFALVKGEKVRVLRLLYGTLVSLGAYVGLDDFDAVLRRVPQELGAIRKSRRFAVEVSRRAARLPRAVRERRDQWDA
jgi:hypothetical protein